MIVQDQRFICTFNKCQFDKNKTLFCSNKHLGRKKQRKGKNLKHVKNIKIKFGSEFFTTFYKNYTCMSVGKGEGGGAMLAGFSS